MEEGRICAFTASFFSVRQELMVGPDRTMPSLLRPSIIYLLRRGGRPQCRCELLNSLTACRYQMTLRSVSLRAYLPSMDAL